MSVERVDLIQSLIPTYVYPVQLQIQLMSSLVINARPTAKVLGVYRAMSASTMCTFLSAWNRTHIAFVQSLVTVGLTVILDLKAQSVGYLNVTD